VSTHGHRGKELISIQQPDSPEPLFPRDHYLVTVLDRVTVPFQQSAQGAPLATDVLQSSKRRLESVREILRGLVDLERE
jgi:hypothetical protein